MSAGDLESDLLQRAAAGSREALSQLLLLHYDDLQRHLATRISAELQCRLDPDDVLQQTFVRAAQSIERFESQHRGAFGAWLRTIAENLVKDAEKRGRRERRAAPSLNPPRPGSGGSSWAALVERLAGDGSGPSKAIQRRESIRCLQAALASLPADQREVVQRHYLQGESFEEIAQALNRTKEATRGVCFRARQNLRALLGRSSLYFSG